jgi:hypothetical protein
MTSRRFVRPLLAVGVAATLSSCVQVPDHGDVVDANPRGTGQPAQQLFNNPPPPGKDDSPAEIVAGFLEAMEATPLRLPPARGYLSKGAQQQWHPSQVLVYGSHTLPQGEDQVEVKLRDADRIASSGYWQGSISADAARLSFPMVREGGEWRISDPPDALILQRGFYEQNYTSQDTSQDTSLYYFDPTGRILVPEQVHAPQGSQLASALVQGLLQGPGRAMRGVEQSSFPPDLTMALPVAVDHDVAQVSLNGASPGPLPRTTTRLMLAQLAWTLRQDPSVTAFTLEVDGHAVTDAEGLSRIPVRAEEFQRYDPTWDAATLVTYALRRGLLVSGPVGDLTKVMGPFGTHDLGIGAFAVSLDGDSVAAVGEDSLRLGQVLGDSPPVVVQSGPGLLRPAWDFADRLWEVQNSPDGASVDYFAGGKRHRVRVRGVSGRSVRTFTVSRDGSRLVAVVRGPDRDRLVVSRLRYNAEGRATGASRAETIPWHAPGARRIRDIGWTTPTTILVLDQVSPSRSEVRILNVDGSTRPGEVSPTPIQGRARYLVTSPAGQTPQTSYVVTESGLTDLSPAEPNRPIQITGLRHITYAG